MNDDDEARPRKSGRGGKRPGAGRPKGSKTALDMKPAPPELAGDALHLWIAHREITRLRHRAGSPDHRTAAACSKVLISWIDLARRITREMSIANDPRVVDLLAIVRAAAEDLDRARAAQVVALEALRVEVEGLLGGITLRTVVPELPSYIETIDAACARAVQRRNAA